jgi:hypothetical protein
VESALRRPRSIKSSSLFQFPAKTFEFFEIGCALTFTGEPQPQRTQRGGRVQGSWASVSVLSVSTTHILSCLCDSLAQDKGKGGGGGRQKHQHEGGGVSTSQTNTHTLSVCLSALDGALSTLTAGRRQGRRLGWNEARSRRVVSYTNCGRTKENKKKRK